MTQVRQGRLETILKAIWECQGCTRKEIAEALGLKKTPHIINLLNQVVADGWALQETDLTTWPHRIRYYPSETMKQWYLEREVQA